MAMTPEQERLNHAYDALRRAMARLPPEYGEIVRRDLTVLIAAATGEIARYSRRALAVSKEVFIPEHPASVGMGLVARDDDTRVTVRKDWLADPIAAEEGEWWKRLT